MREIGIDMSQSHPKQLSRATLESLDLVIHMGCGAPVRVLHPVPAAPAPRAGGEEGDAWHHGDEGAGQAQEVHGAGDASPVHEASR